MAGAGAAAAFAALPPVIRDCLRAAGPEFRSAARSRPLAFAKEIKALLCSSAAEFGCRPEEALFLTGFDKNNTTPGRLEAALAELRAALFLKAEGFSGVGPVGLAAGKTADLRARLGGDVYVFEVRWVRGGFGAGAVKRLAAKCHKKSVQVGASIKKSGASRGAIVLVAGPPYAAAFNTSVELAAAAEAVHSSACRAGRHVCLISGSAAAVYPPWGS